MCFHKLVGARLVKHAKLTDVSLSDVRQVSVTSSPWSRMRRTKMTWMALPMLASWKIPATCQHGHNAPLKADRMSGTRCDEQNLTQTPYHVHDGEDVRLHVVASVVLDKFGVGHHHGLHPALSADRALRAGPSRILLALLLPLPLLSLPLHLDGVAWGI